MGLAAWLVAHDHRPEPAEAQPLPLKPTACHSMSLPGPDDDMKRQVAAWEWQVRAAVGPSCHSMFLQGPDDDIKWQDVGDDDMEWHVGRRPLRRATPGAAG